MVIGTIIGIVSGYSGKAVDNIPDADHRLSSCDSPGFALMMVLAAILGTIIWNIILVIA
jgi:ABC-type dipeptide/oligopeptide/nickel transport system permease subunit